MDEIILTERIDQWRTLCISELSEETLADCEALHFGEPGGAYLYIADERPNVGGISVLGKLTSYDAALQFIETIAPLLRLSAPSRDDITDHCLA